MDAAGARSQDRPTAGDIPHPSGFASEVHEWISRSLTIWCISRTSCCSSRIRCATFSGCGGLRSPPRSSTSRTFSSRERCSGRRFSGHWCLHRHQSVSDHAHLSRAPPDRALRGRTEAVRPRLSFASSARIHGAGVRGRVEERGRRREDADRRGGGIGRLHPDHRKGRSPPAERAESGRLEPGQIIGTALSLTGEPSPVEVVFSEPARYMRWSMPSLRSFMDKRPDLRVALQQLVNRDLVSKLEAFLSRRASSVSASRPGSTSPGPCPTPG